MRFQRIVRLHNNVEIQKQPPEVFYEKDVLRNFAKLTEKHLCQGLFLIKLQTQAFNFIKKETVAQVFSYEVRKMSKNTFFTEHLRTTASRNNKSFFSERQIGIQFKRISHQITELLSFLFEKVITYTIIVLSRKIFKQISEVLCNSVYLVIKYQ